MKNLDLNELGVQEMNFTMQSETNGGFLGLLAAGLIVAGVVWGAANFVKDVIVEGEQFDMTKW
jgi:hypothetical protein